MGEVFGFGTRVFIVRSWLSHVEMRWVHLRPGRCPPRGQRKGTRRQWKRANPRGLRWRPVTILDEPDHVIQTGDAIYCTAAQAAEINRKARAAIQGDKS